MCCEVPFISMKQSMNGKDSLPFITNACKTTERQTEAVISLMVHKMNGSRRGKDVS